MRALLDVNTLIALHDADHVHHEVASRWFRENDQAGWASCPRTQNGCLRIMSQPGYSNPQPLAQLMNMLRRSTAAPLHEHWPDELSILDTARFEHAHVHSARQLTDLYLLALAVHRGGRLVTFDLRIPISAVRGATGKHLVTLLA